MMMPSTRRQIERGQREQVAHQHAPLIGRLFVNGAQTPAADQRRPVERADGDVAVARIQR